jgi:ketosteroid isomerase-like protein
MTADEAALLRLCVSFAERIDGGHAASVTELFTPDGVLVSSGERVSGAAALRERFTRREAGLVTRHLITNASFAIEEPERASGRMLMTVFRRRDGDTGVAPPRVADVEDVYVRGAGGQWRIAQRRIERVFGP